ncbi:MAG TPA: vanadium-dependent haloperoxidase [Candidatus Binatus sp.]|uniref:vanadium-dependent haloperoxidase n=1 Tax=Candidatus Binatus sp. TaxID=2811406 RepID=UPI002F41D20E
MTKHFSGKHQSGANADLTDTTVKSSGAPKSPGRRRFIAGLGAATAAASTGVLAPLVAASSASARETPDLPTQSDFGAGRSGNGLPASVTHDRLVQAFSLRVGEATHDALVGPAVNVNNGDPARYADQGGTYTKGLPHDDFGRVDLQAFASFTDALNSGGFSDFQKIVVGGTRTLNGPQGGLAFDLAALDNVQFGQPQVPPAPRTASDQNATELLEHYWASLLRDVAFTDYSSSALAVAAAAELGSQPAYFGPRSGGKVTPNLLFRGAFPGEALGPYISQFFIKPTALGAQPMSQQMTCYQPDIDYMYSFGDWLTAQDGNVTGLKNQIDSQLRYMRNGRDLSAFTHVDLLYQAYFTALLVLGTIGTPLNPGNPYIGSKTENGFGTFGAPDFAGTLTEVATKALNAVWYQKWFVHLRPRPEAIGGIVHLIMTGQSNKTDVTLSNVILSSIGLQQSFTKYGTWLLSQAFPEGSPTHPSYPTGHGVVGGACITVLKFFFDGSFVIPNPKVPSDDGLSLLDYPGPDVLTVNGELNKLGHNVSFGHGIHAGIHWRSDTDTSLLLGEAVALSFLKDRARTYNEPFTIHLTKFDGTTATFSNRGNP